MLVAKIEAKRSLQDDEEPVMPNRRRSDASAGCARDRSGDVAIRDQDEFERIRSEIV
jgi:hypothetical protein